VVKMPILDILPAQLIHLYPESNTQHSAPSHLCLENMKPFPSFFVVTNVEKKITLEQDLNTCFMPQKTYQFDNLTV